ncbi:MAG: hypothetical protein JW763_00425 [candidate division Zixibacteria bacterium]|nr:hypothetical protein [candidate division Zixibacteria bacterium]
MTPPQLYALLLGIVIIAHRIPGVVSPRSFRRWYTHVTTRPALVCPAAFVLAVFVLWGVYVTFANYRSPGWFIFGLSLFILYKAMIYLLIPRKAAAWDRDANNQPDRVIAILSAMIIFGGIWVLIVGLVLMQT